MVYLVIYTVDTVSNTYVVYIDVLCCVECFVISLEPFAAFIIM